MADVTSLGFGLGLRPKHAGALLAAPEPTKVDWLEIVSENYIGAGGRPRSLLSKIRERFPVVMHGVGLSIASSDPLNERYLIGLKELASWVEPRLISDHLCWTNHKGANSHDLLPIAYTRETLAHVAARVERVQEVLGTRLYLENPSAYVAFAASDMTEADFLAELSRRTGCGLLLDVNNLFVNSKNLGTAVDHYLAALSAESIGYFHLAGHTVRPDIRIDTHDEQVPDEVWAVYKDAVQRFPKVATLIEWDDHLPELPRLIAELDKAREAHASALTASRAAVTMPTGRVSTEPVQATSSQGASWATLQSELWRMVTARQSIEGDDKGLSMLDANLPASSLVGINVYADAYHLRISDVARDVFPSLVNVLGIETFNRLIVAYLGEHPSRDVSIKYAISGFPAYLKTCELPVSSGVANQVLADVAALEWATEDLFDYPDSPAPLSVAVLEEIAPDDWERVAFDFIKAVAIVHTQYDVGPVLDAVADELPPERPVLQTSAYVVFRAEHDVERRAITTEEGYLLELLIGGLPFQAACLRLDTSGGEDQELVERACAALVRWLSWGLVHGIKTTA